LNYLPVDEPGMIDDGKDAPDWESIMLCKFPSFGSSMFIVNAQFVFSDPSNAGGKTVDGVKQQVLVKRNGDPITPNFKPSKRDVQGLRRMYGVKAPSFLHKLLGDKSNSLKNIFDKIRKKDSDSSCV
jgi:hypothetical protein